MFVHTVDTRYLSRRVTLLGLHITVVNYLYALTRHAL